MLLTTVTVWADVKVNITGNGIVTLNGNSVSSGATNYVNGNYTLSITPANGYVLQAVTRATDMNPTHVDVTSQLTESSGVYSHNDWTNMDTDHEYNVFFVEQGTSGYALMSLVNDPFGVGTMTFSVGGQTVTSAEAGARVDITMSNPYVSEMHWELLSPQVIITQDDATHFHFTMPTKVVVVNASLESQLVQVYQIVDNSTHGYVAVSGGDSNGFFEGSETATMTPTPDTGYEYVANSLTATNNSTQTTIYLTNNGNGTWSFQMPASNVIVSASFTLINYTVHFDSNGGTGTMANQAFTYNEVKTLTANAFTHEGYEFTGWSTTPSGSVVYTDGQSVSNLANSKGATVTLYAQWKAIYTVHFDANGGTGTMDDQNIEPNTNTNLCANAFTRSGYVFLGWSTTSDGDVVYTDGQSVTNIAEAGQTITLYARWTDTYTVHFDKNELDIFVTGSMADQTFHAGETKQLSKCTFTSPADYTFLGWSTTADGSVVYIDEQSVCDLTTPNTDITLYAQWQAPAVSVTHTVHFDANGGTGTMANQVYSIMERAKLTANTFTRDGYSFTNWNTAADGSGTTYTDQQNIHPSSDMTLYAQWSLNASTYYAVRFNANGGEGTMFDQAIEAGASANLTACTFTREGYNFTGWSTTADGSVEYADGQSVSGLANAGQTFNLYAQWQEVTGPATTYAVTVNNGTGNGSFAEGASVTITANDPEAGWQFKEWTGTDGLTFTNGSATTATATFTMPDGDVTITATFAPDPAHFSQNGDNYTIKTATGWNLFCDFLEDNATWNRFSGKTVRFGADIAVSRMAGSRYHDFCGTFDGDGHTLTFNHGTSDSYASDEYTAPFCYVSTVTPEGGSEVPTNFRNLHVAGDIYTTAKYAAGLIARQWGTVNVENCRSSIVVHSNVSNDGNDGTHGGFVSVQQNGTLSFTGCTFDGKLLTDANNVTTKCGGFVGYRSSGNSIVTNSLYAPAALADGETEAVGNSATFVRNGNANTITNSYYTATLGTEQGTAPRTVSGGENVTVEAVSPVGDATATYTVSGITAYAKGITRTVGEAATFYYGEGDAVSLTIQNTAPTTLHAFSAYTASGGTLSGTENPYTLTMPDADVTISADYTLKPVTYLDADGKQQTCTDYTAIYSGNKLTSLGAGWYVVTGTVSYSSTVNLNAEANLILLDGCQMNIGTNENRINGDGIRYNGNVPLTIYGQSMGSGALSVYTIGSGHYGKRRHPHYQRRSRHSQHHRLRCRSHLCLKELQLQRRQRHHQHRQRKSHLGIRL